MAEPLRIPELVQDKISPRALKTLTAVKKFVEEECIPADTIFHSQISREPATRWKTFPSVIEDLKAKAKARGLWNLFLSSHYSEGAGYTNLEYALMAEQMGRCHTAPEAMNCNAPDTGNMEVLAKYGNAQQKKQYLEPLLRGECRSAFCMTEKGISSSDATNIQLSMRRDGDDFVLNGTKWWASGAGDPRCKIWLVMGKTTDANGKSISTNSHLQQSVIIVPANHPGAKVIRPMYVYGYDDAPHGHCEIEFVNCRVPASNIVLGEGRGFEIIQGRLGPGRLHHCMRTLGAAEEALKWLIYRANDPRRKTFGKLLKDHGTVLNDIARSRLEIDAGRLLVLAAAHSVDVGGAHHAMLEISKAKIECPTICCRVVDRVIQVFGAEGISQDTPLASIYAFNRTLRIADGPDEVHLFQLGRRENSRYDVIKDTMETAHNRIRSHI